MSGAISKGNPNVMTLHSIQLFSLLSKDLFMGFSGLSCSHICFITFLIIIWILINISTLDMNFGDWLMNMSHHSDTVSKESFLVSLLSNAKII